MELTLKDMFSDGGEGLSTDERAIAEIEREIDSAQSFEGVTRSWDDETVFYDMQPGQLVGSSAAGRKIAGQFSTQREVRLRIIRMQVGANESIGYAFSTIAYDSDAADGGPGPNLIFRRTSIYEKKNGTWRMRHMHTSVPFDLASGMAQLHADGDA
jgi:ketosteroid isomerase-like protein